MRRIILLVAALIASVPLILTGTGQASAADWTEIGMYNHPGWCLTITSSNPAPGDPVFLYQCYQNSNQGWDFLYYADGTDAIRTELLGTNGQHNCIAEDGGSGADGTPMIIWPCNNAQYEHFSPVPMGLPSPAAAWVNPTSGTAISLDGDVIADYTTFICWHWVYRADYQELYP